MFSGRIFLSSYFLGETGFFKFWVHGNLMDRFIDLRMRLMAEVIGLLARLIRKLIPSAIKVLVLRKSSKDLCLLCYDVEPRLREWEALICSGSFIFLFCFVPFYFYFCCSHLKGSFILLGSL